MMIQARTVAELRTHINSLKQEGKEIGFVPTMGALHKGHVALVNMAKKLSDVVVVSTFINPLQFSVDEDLESYPRMEEADVKLLEGLGVDIVYMPSLQEMYPEGFSALVQTQAFSEILCAKSRPGHFDGVATVVTKLLNQVGPQRVFMGEKDYQQLCVVRALVRDLNFQVKIFGVPTVREADGLAVSSRNAYLDEEQRQIAAGMHEILALLATKATQGRSPTYYLAREGRNMLVAKGFSKVEYLEFRDAETLEEVTNTISRPTRLLAAVRLGTTRLIDNVEVLP